MKLHTNFAMLLALFFNVFFVQINFCQQQLQDDAAEFYTTDFVKNGLLQDRDIKQEKNLDALAIEYCKNHKNTYIAVVYPLAIITNEEVEAFLNQCGPIIHKKNVYLKNEGPFYLLKHIYTIKQVSARTADWIGNWENNFVNVRVAAKARIPKGEGLLRFYLFECDNVKKVREVKEMVRSILKKRTGKGKGIHTTDFHPETVSLAHVVFNNNSIEFLNTKKHIKFDKFEQYLTEYKQWIKFNNLNPADCCVVGDAVRSVYGLQDCAHFSFVHQGNDAMLSLLNNPHITSYNNVLKDSSFGLGDLLFNQENYFYYEDIKFATLRAAHMMAKMNKSNV
jgi:hypothetical protein